MNHKVVDKWNKISLDLIKACEFTKTSEDD